MTIPHSVVADVFLNRYFALALLGIGLSLVGHLFYNNGYPLWCAISVWLLAALITCSGIGGAAFGGIGRFWGL